MIREEQLRTIADLSKDVEDQLHPELCFVQRPPLFDQSIIDLDISMDSAVNELQCSWRWISCGF